VRIIG